MMTTSLPLTLLIFAASLVVLLIAARWFTRAAELLGAKAGLSPFVTGIIIVGIGTSLPELVSSLISAAKGSTEIVAGNVLGANLANILLILGVLALFSKNGISLHGEVLQIDLNFLLGGTVMASMMFFDGGISRAEAVFLIAAYGIYTYYLLAAGSNAPQEEAQEQSRLWLQLLILLLAGVAIYFGADYTVASIVRAGEILEINPALISLTALSLGTTLPELAVSITAARQGKAQIAVGNILGSCIFNLMMVVGIPALIQPVAIPQSLQVFALPVLAASTLMFYLLTRDKQISRWEGAFFMLFYLAFLAKTLNLA